ncbi:MAG TPA: hypothetical protein VGH83_11345, partial [Candidatus Acidoferrum sp.]
MNSDILFDLRNKAYDWKVWQVAILFAGGPILVWLGRKTTSRLSVPKIGYILCAASLLFAAFEVGNYFADRHKAVRLLNSGSAAIVEGVVTNFRPMPPEGHQLESFEIASQTFSYSDYVLTPCFNKTASHGGPIRQGLELRIWY